MAREISLTFALGARLTSGYSAAFRGAAAQAGAVARAVRQMEQTPVGKVGAAMKAQKEKIRGLSGSLREAQSRLAGLWQRAEQAGTMSLTLARQIEQAERQVRGLSGALSRQASQYRETVAQAASVGGSVRGLTADYARLSQEVERARRMGQALAANATQADALRAQRADLQSRLLGTAMTGAAVAMPVKLAISAEDTFADLRKVMDAPESVMQQVFADAQAMSNRTGKSFEDVVTIMTAAAQAGLGTTREQLLGVADQAVKMSIAWGVSAEQAGKSLATWQAAMGMTAEESRHTADVINALSNAMNAEAGEVNQIFTRMGPLMQASGFAAQDIAALATAFKAAGAEVEVSGTAMKNFVKVMAAGEAGLTDERKAIYQYLQIDPNKLQKELQTDAMGAVMRVLEALRRVRPEERNAISTLLFGDESIAAIAPIMGQIMTLRQAFQIANSDVSGSVDQEYANRMKTTATALSQLSQGVRNLGVTVGSALLPVVGAAARVLSGAVGVVSDLARRCPRLTAAVAGVAAGIGVLAVGSLALGLMMNVVRTGINGVGGVLLQMAAAQITAANGTRTLTLWQRASALASLSWRDVLSGLGGGIARLGQGLAALVGWQRGATLSTILLSAVQRGAAMASAVFSGGLKIVGLALRFALGPLGIVLTALTVGAGLVIDNWSTVGPFFKSLWDDIVSVFQAAWSVIKGIMDSVAKGLAWIGKKIDETPILGSAKRGLSKGFKALFGGDEEEKTPDVAPNATAAARDNAAPHAVPAPQPPSGPSLPGLPGMPDIFGTALPGMPEMPDMAGMPDIFGTALPDMPDMADMAGTALPEMPDMAGTGAFDQSFNDFMAARDKKGGKGGSGGGRGRGGRTQGGPVTVVTLAGDNARPQTLFIPAARSAGSGAGASLMASGGPGAALPQTPALLAGRKGKAAPAGADENRGGLHVELHQQFGLVGDPRAVRQIMEHLKPDFEQLVRRALDKLASDRRRTAYAQ